MDLCIYSKDETTEFLQPVYDRICEVPGFEGFDKDSTDDDFVDKLSSKLEQAEYIVFLGHGTNDGLYGARDNLIISSDDKEYIELLRSKNNILFSCKSNDFIKKNRLSQSVGFGFIPTDLQDFRNAFRVNYKIDTSELGLLEASLFKKCLCRIWLRTLKDVSIRNVHAFAHQFAFYTTVEMVDMLVQSKDLESCHTLASMFYQLKKDMCVVE